jgi:tetratricopeptide (TPR) repeat protein
MLELYFEHRNYMPLVGPMMALALGMARLQQGQLRHLLLVFAGLWLLACSFTTWLSARVYASGDSLALTWANDQPNSARAQNYLAERLYKHGQLAPALLVLDKAMRNHPDNAGLAENRVFVKCMQGRLTRVDLDNLNTRLQMAGFDRGGMEGMGPLRLLAASRRCSMLTPRAWLELTNTLLANPHYRDYSVAAGFLHYQRHYWAVSQGNLGMAIQELDATYRYDPDANIPRLKAKYLVSAGLYDQAIDTLRDTDYNRLPLLRRLLVNDRAINASDIALIEKMRAGATGKSDGNAR